MNKHLIYQENAVKLLDDLENRIAEEEGWQEKCDGVFQAKELIANMITIEAEPVRHGRWIETDYFDAHKVPIYECSVCFQEVADHYIKCHKYCLHCGAKMDAEENHNGKN